MTFRVTFQQDGVGILKVWEDVTASEACAKVAELHEYARTLGLVGSEYTVSMYEWGW